MTGDLEKVAERIRKLLALADRNKSATTEAEAASAMAKAQALLEAHNLSMSSIEQGGDKDGKREDARVQAGMYKYERRLWREIAELNFCIHFLRRKAEPRGKGFKYTFFHQVVGRTVNVVATKVMADYITGTIERLCKERLVVISGAGATPGHLNSQFFSQWAVGFREGIVDRVCEKMYDRRQQLLKDEEKRLRAAERAAKRTGASTSTALTLSTVKQRERDANMDFMYGEGWSAARAAERAARQAEEARIEAEAEAEYTAWVKEHPELAAKREADARKERERRWKRRDRYVPRYRRQGISAEDRRRETGGYHEGYEVGDKVSIDPQVDEDKRRIGRG